MKKNKSFVRFCVQYLTIYSIILFIIFLFINSVINKNLINISLDITSIFEYDDILKNDDFNNLPVKKYARNEIYIFDENDNIIFKTNNYEKNILKKKTFYLLITI